MPIPHIYWSANDMKTTTKIPHSETHFSIPTEQFMFVLSSQLTCYRRRRSKFILLECLFRFESCVVVFMFWLKIISWFHFSAYRNKFYRTQLSSTFNWSMKQFFSGEKGKKAINACIITNQNECFFNWMIFSLFQIGKKRHFFVCQINKLTELLKLIENYKFNPFLTLNKNIQIEFFPR